MAREARKGIGVNGWRIFIGLGGLTIGALVYLIDRPSTPQQEWWARKTVDEPTLLTTYTEMNPSFLRELLHNLLPYLFSLLLAQFIKVRVGHS